MTNNMQAGFLPLVLAAALAGCNGGNTRSPTAPSEPRGILTLSHRGGDTYYMMSVSGWRDAKITGDTRLDIELVRK